jgi:hypothetical protein
VWKNTCSTSPTKNATAISTASPSSSLATIS